MPDIEVRDDGTLTTGKVTTWGPEECGPDAGFKCGAFNIQFHYRGVIYDVSSTFWVKPDGMLEFDASNFEAVNNRDDPGHCVFMRREDWDAIRVSGDWPPEDWKPRDRRGES